jgi:hypothetical protein
MLRRLGGREPAESLAEPVARHISVMCQGLALAGLRNDKCKQCAMLEISYV